MPRILSLIFVFFCVFFVAKSRAQTEFSVHFDFENPTQKIVLPAEMREISGLTFSENEKHFLAICDEKGQIFFINKKSGAVEKSKIFRERGDFEDVAAVNDSVFCVKSDGDLYKITDLDDGSPTVEKFESGFLNEEDHDIEGMCFDQKNRRILLVSKGPADNFEPRGVFSFLIDSNKFAEKPIFLIDPCEIERFLGKKGKPFSPSGIAIEPVSGDFYVLSSVGKRLAIFSSDGKLNGVLKLDKEIFPQPEGIVFSTDGRLFISSEGKTDAAVILEFEQKKH
jgi:uncharacterized protein YjiK